MPERRITIAKKQHATLTQLFGQKQAIEHQISTVASTILQGQEEEDFGEVVILGPHVEDGVHMLVLNVPETPKATKPGRGARR